VVSNKIPFSIVSSKAANAKMEPRIGPMQGVHPNPKANPNNNGDKNPALILLLKKFIFLSRKGILIISAIINPNIIIKVPITLVKIFKFFISAVPKAVAPAPRIIKTNENPKTNSSEFFNTSSFDLVFISLNVVPTIYDMYAGISGSTHGEIKLTNPAKNVSVKEIIITLLGAFRCPNLFSLLSFHNDF